MESLRSCLPCTVPPGVADRSSSESDHGRLRRILGCGFTNTALAAVEPSIKTQVLRLCEILKREANSGPVDLSKWFACFSFDVSLRWNSIDD